MESPRPTSESGSDSSWVFANDIAYFTSSDSEVESDVKPGSESNLSGMCSSSENSYNVVKDAKTEGERPTAVAQRSNDEPLIPSTMILFKCVYFIACGVTVVTCFQWQWTNVRVVLDSHTGVQKVMQPRSDLENVRVRPSPSFAPYTNATLAPPGKSLRNVFQPPVYDIEWLARNYYTEVAVGRPTSSVTSLAVAPLSTSRQLVVLPPPVTPWAGQRSFHKIIKHACGVRPAAFSYALSNVTMSLNIASVTSGKQVKSIPRLSMKHVKLWGTTFDAQVPDKTRDVAELFTTGGKNVLGRHVTKLSSVLRNLTMSLKMLRERSHGGHRAKKERPSVQVIELLAHKRNHRVVQRIAAFSSFLRNLTISKKMTRATVGKQVRNKPRSLMTHVKLVRTACDTQVTEKARSPRKLAGPFTTRGKNVLGRHVTKLSSVLSNRTMSLQMLRERSNGGHHRTTEKRSREVTERIAHKHNHKVARRNATLFSIMRNLTMSLKMTSATSGVPRTSTPDSLVTLSASLKKKAHKRGSSYKRTMHRGYRWSPHMLIAERWIKRDTATVANVLRTTFGVTSTGVPWADHNGVKNHTNENALRPRSRHKTRVLDFTKGKHTIARRGLFALMVHPSAAYGVGKTCKRRALRAPVYDIEWLSRFYYTPRAHMMLPVTAVTALQPCVARKCVVSTEMLAHWSTKQRAISDKRCSMSKVVVTRRKKTRDEQLTQQPRVMRTLIHPFEKSSAHHHAPLEVKAHMHKSVRMVSRTKEESARARDTATGNRWINGLVAAKMLMQRLARKEYSQQPAWQNTTSAFECNISHSEPRDKDDEWMNERRLTPCFFPTNQNRAPRMARQGPFPLIVHPAAAHGASTTCKRRVRRQPVFDVEWLSRFYYPQVGHITRPVASLTALQPYMGTLPLANPTMDTRWCDIEGRGMSTKETLATYGTQGRARMSGLTRTRTPRMSRTVIPSFESPETGKPDHVLNTMRIWFEDTHAAYDSQEKDTLSARKVRTTSMPSAETTERDTYRTLFTKLTMSIEESRARFTSAFFLSKIMRNGKEAMKSNTTMKFSAQRTASISPPVPPFSRRHGRML